VADADAIALFIVHPANLKSDSNRNQEIGKRPTAEARKQVTMPAGFGPK
jgi:hypothetical protein